MGTSSLNVKLSILLCCVGVGSAFGQATIPIKNSELGFAIELPPGFGRAPNAADDARLRRDDQGLDCDSFVSEGVTITVCRYLPDSSAMHMRWKELFDMKSASNNSQVVTYSKFNEKWFVVSGSSDTLFYERVIQSDDAVASFLVEFQERDKARIDPWIGKLGKSFKLIPKVVAAPPANGPGEMAPCKTNAECTNASFSKCDRDIGCMECTVDADCKRPVAPVCARGRFGIGRCSRRE